MPADIQYVLAFAFDDLGRVALIRKRRPQWQSGRLNGIGGKVEGSEPLVLAMSREFYEETGVQIEPEKWRAVGVMGKASWVVHVFTTTCEAVRMARTSTDEQVNLFVRSSMHLWRHQCIENVPTLIELCTLPPQDPGDRGPFFKLYY